jgi:hypothetical protein
MRHDFLFQGQANLRYNQFMMSDEDFASQLRGFFASGTQLQELYLTPRLLNRQNRDDLAEAAKWARANAYVLKDTHWVGGDPGKGEIYGWASWSPGKAILTWRNPGNQSASFTTDAAGLFELPSSETGEIFHLHSPWQADRNRPVLEIRAGTRHTFLLRPFEILTLESR